MTELYGIIAELQKQLSTLQNGRIVEEDEDEEEEDVENGALEELDISDDDDADDYFEDGILYDDGKKYGNLRKEYTQNFYGSFTINFCKFGKKFTCRVNNPKKITLKS